MIVYDEGDSSMISDNCDVMKSFENRWVAQISLGLFARSWSLVWSIGLLRIQSPWHSSDFVSLQNKEF